MSETNELRKLTAEQVRTAIFNGSSYASYDGVKYYADGISMRAIADELNAELGSGTCRITTIRANGSSCHVVIASRSTAWKRQLRVLCAGMW